ncbi:cysteine-rich receptor-like protein kinase 40 [Carica papaya]|uniref:cysteine-rich receptor-like protein kinase 40 n=1 Tax=Carica papaya TaxID=3649 RepID=UPI000B8CD7B5|nr:cysteine-rich receptor-like protein kinase 40 [Carica papaya]
MGFLSSLFTCFSEEPEDEEEWNISFDLRTLQVSTNFFSESNFLGDGGYGRLYKGLMPNGQEVAVRKFSEWCVPLNFRNEMKLLIEIYHENLVTLLGYCEEGSGRMLVYEYLPNGSLDNFLFDKDKFSCLDWTTRFRIVKGVARGLLYLHEEVPGSGTIIHSSICARKILLDEKFNPKISDFGIAKLFPEKSTYVNVSMISGVLGYMAPELMHGYLSAKADVFSFGILVLEIVSGIKAWLAEANESLLENSWKLYKEGKSLELVDSNLSQYNCEEAAKCIQIGLLCCEESHKYRPDMKSVNLMLSSESSTLPTPISISMEDDESICCLSVSSYDEGR